MDMREAIEGRLKTLNPVFFDFQDDSHLHAGHAGNKGGGHYTVVVVSEAPICLTFCTSRASSPTGQPTGARASNTTASPPGPAITGKPLSCRFMHAS